jgi:hypothetical protein
MVLIALAAVTVIVVVAMMMKKSAPTDVSADSGTTATPPAVPAQTNTNAANAPAPTPTPAAPEVGTTKQDREFRDPKNRFTIRVGQYDNDPVGKAAALAAYRFLITEGLPVIAPVVASDGQHLVLCVGAEAKKDDLNSQLKWLHDARGPASGKKNPYADAWVDNIDHVVRR